jgi:hypothetical protein
MRSNSGIDGGFSFVFRRRDLEGMDLHEIATVPYRSPAGRKPAADRPGDIGTLTTRDTARALGIPVRRVRMAVDEG